MHEYSIVQALLERVDEQLRTRGAVSVHRLRLRIGELSGVEPELLRSAFLTFRYRTPCANADLEIENVKAEWRCRSCRRPIRPGEVLRCDACGSAGQLHGGDEIVLDQIEMEVP
jgi:hydrogenase nickel incorporation protein HypA/HybF